MAWVWDLNEDEVAAMSMVKLLAGMSLNVEQEMPRVLMDKISKFDGVMPLVDPSAWMKVDREAASLHLALLRAFQQLQSAARAIQERGALVEENQRGD